MQDKKIKGDSANGTIHGKEAGSSQTEDQTEDSRKAKISGVDDESEKIITSEEENLTSKEDDTEKVESPEEEKLRIKREKDRESKRLKRQAEKTNTPIPANVVPMTPSSKAKDKAKPKASTFTADLLAKQIYGTHELMVLFLGEEARISKESAVMLGEAAYEVLKEYDLAFIGKYGKWFGLITAAAIVETPVIFALRNKAARSHTQPMVQVADSFAPANSDLGVARGTPS